MKGIRRILITLILAVVGGSAFSVFAADATRAEALRYKQAGDRYAAQEQYDRAAEEYLRALRLTRDFPEAERVRMAVAIAWGNRPGEASEELRLVLSQNPANTEARIHRARFLAWAGKLDEALAEIESALARSPLNRDAILVRADVLRWQERHGEALRLYDVLLSSGEHFDALLGKTYSLLAIGRRKEAQQHFARLAPRFPYQERERDRLRAELDRATRTIVAVSTTTYHDTDHNDAGRYTLNGTVPAGNASAALTYRRTEARDPLRRATADEIDVRLSGGLSGRVQAGIGIGAAREDARDRTGGTVLTASANADVVVPRGSAGVWTSSRMLTDTAELIANRIRMTVTGVSLRRQFSAGLSCAGSYAYRRYSDANDAHDIQASCGYVLRTGRPALTVHYRFRFTDFDRQSGGGYFDPDGFVSHLIAPVFTWEEGRFSASLEPQFGVQSFERYGTARREFVTWGYASAGWAVTTAARFEVNIEGGDYAAQAGAYRYYQAGAVLRLSY